MDQVRALDVAGELVGALDAAGELVGALDVAGELVAALDVAGELVGALDLAGQLVAEAMEPTGQAYAEGDRGMCRGPSVDVGRPGTIDVARADSRNTTEAGRHP